MSQERLVDTFVELADTLIDDFDVIDLLHLLVDRCVELLDVDAAGLLLVNPAGDLQLVASSNEKVRLLELFQLRHDEGPCLEAFRTGAPSNYLEQGSVQRWPRFAAAARDAGFGSVHALPMRLRTETIGALNLFRVSPGTLDPTSLRTARALVDVATIGLLQERSLRNQELLTEQLQTALNSRIVIEQAKGLIAERLKLDMVAAFGVLRSYARGNRLKLSDVARAVIDRTISTDQLSGAASSSSGNGRPAE